MLAKKSAPSATVQPSSAPAARVTTSWTSSSDAKPSASAVKANEPIRIVS